MDINVLKTFVAVCEYSGFSAAGEKLGYSQSTVSSQIKQLENELDTVLFDRIRHNTKVTEQGAIVLEYARQILELNYKMQDTLHHPERIAGEIRLAMSDSVCAHYFTEDFLRFHEKYPNISLKISSAGTKQMFDMLRKNEVDMLFTLEARVFDSEYVSCADAMEPTHFVVAAGHPLAGEQHLRMKDLVEETFFLTEPNMSYRKMLDQRLAEESLQINPIVEIGNPSQICQILAESRAISFLPDYVTNRYVQEGKLVYLQVEDCDITVWSQILIHKNKWRSRAMDTFIDFYREIVVGK